MSASTQPTPEERSDSAQQAAHDPMSRLEVVLVALLTALCLFLPFPYLDQPGAKNQLDNPNEVMRAYSVRAAAEFGHLYINDVVDQWPTRRTDMSGRSRRPDEPKSHPKKLLYPSKSPGMALIAIPSWWVYHHVSAWVGHEVTREDLVNVCRLSMQALLWPMCIALYLFLRRMTRRRFIAQAVYWSMTLGTMGYAYSMIFASHQLATMSLFTLFAILAWRPQRVLATYPRASTHALYGLGGMLGGLAVSAEYSAVLPACLIGLYGVFRGTAPVEETPESSSVGAKLLAFARSRRHLWSVLGGVLPLAAYTMWYHKLTFGGVLETPYKHMLNPVFRRRMEESAGGFQSPSLERFFEIFFGTTNGLFILSPFLLLAITGVAVWVWTRRHTLEVMLGVAITGVMTLYLSSVAFEWIGGWSVGPRYLSNVLPAMGLLAAYGLDELDDRRRLVTRALLGGLGGASILLTAPVSMVFPHIPGWVKHPALDASLALAREAVVPINRPGLPDPLFAALAYGLLGGLCVWMLAGATRRHTRQITASVTVFVIALWAIVSIEEPDPKRGRFVDYVHKFEAPQKTKKSRTTKTRQKGNPR